MHKAEFLVSFVFHFQMKTEGKTASGLLELHSNLVCGYILSSTDWEASHKEMDRNSKAAKKFTPVLRHFQASSKTSTLPPWQLHTHKDSNIGQVGKVWHCSCTPYFTQRKLSCLLNIFPWETRTVILLSWNMAWMWGFQSYTNGNHFYSFQTYARQHSSSKSDSII